MDLKFQPMLSFSVDEATDPGYDMPFFHYHPEYELFFIDQGNRSIIINNTIVQLSRFDVGLIPSNAFHRTAGPNFSRTIVYFSTEFLEKYYTEAAIRTMLRCFEKPAIKLSADEYFHAKKLFQQLKSENPLNENNKIFLMLGELLMLLTTKVNSIEQSNSSLILADNLVSKTLNYINDNYKTLSSLDEIAAHLFITKYHLCRIFKQVTAMTVNQYIVSIRMKRACELLISSSKTASQISNECGFKTPIYFSQCFKKQFGMTPIAYRKNEKQPQK